MERLTDVIGVSFIAPRVASLDVVESGEQTIDLRFTFCREGPPYLELIEAQGNGVFSAAQGEGLHHLSFYVPDVAARRGEMRDKGAEPEAQIVSPDPSRCIFFADPASMHGIRLEYADARRQPYLEALLESLG